jgi:hypothetical protein
VRDFSLSFLISLQSGELAKLKRLCVINAETVVMQTTAAHLADASKQIRVLGEAAMVRLCLLASCLQWTTRPLLPFCCTQVSTKSTDSWIGALRTERELLRTQKMSCMTDMCDLQVEISLSIDHVVS